MNERIEHCLYQAGLTAQGCWDELDDYAKEGIEKFAELIIRECSVALNPPVQVRNVISRGQAYNLIKQHFGVEE